MISAFLALLQPALAAPPGALISNQATLEYRNIANADVNVDSNIVELTTGVLRSPSSVLLTRVSPNGAGTWQETVGPSACFRGGSFVALPDPTIVGGTVIDATAAQSVVESATYNLGEPLFIRLDDPDQNLDYQVIDNAVVVVSNPDSGDSESVQLSETGPDTGVFAGFLPTAAENAVVEDCVLQGASQSVLEASYTDPVDTDDFSVIQAQFDPVQRVFETQTGVAISGVRLTLVNAANGQPARVYGNDGVSDFPSTIESGATVTDGSGASYDFGPGEYRFPYVPDGNYRLVAEPPSEYYAPSVVAEADLQNLPGAPYALGPASFGEAFSKSGGLSFSFDVPVDPSAESLFLQKQTLTVQAAPGDFIRYELALENPSTTGNASDIEIHDVLPQGTRFVRDSVTINGQVASDPELSQDLSTLVFNIDLLGIGERVVINYVIEVVGGKPGEELVNRATAFAAGGLNSNEASVAVRLTEDLFRSTGTIIGRVLESDCSQESFGEEQGVEGIRIYLEDGSYVVTDEGGRFHFEGVKPGTHVAQIDTFSVPAWFDVVGCSDTPGFAGRGDSQFVKMTRGSLLRADFYLRRKLPPQGKVELELMSSGTDSAEEVRIDLNVNGIGNIDLENIDITLTLPDGVEYQSGTMHVDGEMLGDPRVRGQKLSFALPDRSGNWQSSLGFIAKIDDDASGELTTTAQATFDSPIEAGQQTPVAETKMLREPGTVENAGYVLDLKFDVLSAELTDTDRQKLDDLIRQWRGVRNVLLSAVGHSDSQQIAPRNQHIFSDNYALSRARARSAAEYVADALGLPKTALQVAGRGPDEPVADNATADGRARNRRVEMVLSGVRPSKPSFLEVTKATSGALAVDTQGLVPGMERERKTEVDEEPAAGAEPPLESLSPGTAMLLPEEGYMPPVPAFTVSIQHLPDQQVKAWVNDEPVNPVNFDAIEFNQARTVAVSRWKGVELVDGENQLRVVVSNPDGSEAATFERMINFSGIPIRGEIVPEESLLIADGKTRPVVAVRLYDRSGKPARRGIVGGFRVREPYRSWWDVENHRRNPLIEVASREPTYRIGEDGLALIELEPTTRTGEVELQLLFENYFEQELRTWLKPAPRDWILVGFAEGTAGYNTLSDNADAAMLAGHEDEYYDEGRVAFFAKGRIKGEFLMTLAYDSDREREYSEDAFNTVIDPSRYYPLYADVAEQRFEAPSQRKLYVKIERNQFYALFGDFETGLEVTDLSRYQRRFNGLSSEYRGEHVGYTAFAAESSQSFNRDEIRGDGTSGLYRLTNAPIIANSEEIRIEIRDRFDSGVVLETRTLSRFLDYSLDVLDGSLYFKQPVPSRDLNFNPVYIVAEYETRSTGADDLVAGGRGSVRTANDNFEVGVTHINDQTAGAEADLSGFDVRWQINSQTLLTAEVAESSRTTNTGETAGTAHFVELEHNSENMDLRAFMREVDDEFGLGYQSAADQGVRRLGIDGRARLGERWSVEGEAGWQQMLETEDIRNLARAQLRYENGTFSGTAGLTHAEDSFDDGDTRTSDLAEVSVAKRVYDGKVNLRAQGSMALNDEAESLDFPSRFLLGTDYRIMEGIDLVAEYEEAQGRDIDATMSRLGIRATPWALAQIDTSLTNEVSEYGPRLFANVGLIQGFQLTENWLLDIGFDQSNTLTGPDARQFDPDRELASGSFMDDYLALYTGATYTSELWSANSRVEYRNSDTEERTSLLLGWYREPVAGHGLSAGLTVFTADANTGNTLTNADLRIGWAWRPAYSRWSFLNRLDFVFDNLEADTVRERSFRMINNFNANWRVSAATQLALQYAFKHVRSDFDNAGFKGYTDLVGVDFRRGFRARWDAGINTSVYHSWRADVFDYGLGIDVGYRVATNLWLTLGYNILGFHDDDLVRARYTAQGPYLRFTIKADQQTLKDIAGIR